MGAAAEIDPVQVELKDLVLGVLVLKPDREHGLLHLSLKRAVGLEKQVLGELLGNRAAALYDPAGLDVFIHGADEAKDIDAEVLIEAAILDGHNRLRQILRQLVKTHQITLESAALGEHLTIGRKDNDAALLLRQGVKVGVGDREDDISRRTGAGDADP